MSSSHDSMSRYIAERAPQFAEPRKTRAEILAESYLTAPAPRHRSPRGFTAGHLIAVAIIGALIGLWLSPGRAYAADPIPGGARDVVALDAGPAGPAITVHLSNGAADVLRPCKFEDGRHCYWLASERGNGIGRSLIVTRGRVHHVSSAWLASVV